MSNNERKYLLLIFIIFIAACMETDIYLPAFCDMMQHFSATEEMIQSVLTWNFIGICVSGPFYGPISDAVGRRKPLLVALGLFFAGSVITLFADDFTFMLFGRLLQGLGSGGCFTLGCAIIFDAFQADAAQRAINKLNTMVPFAMAAAPMLGGYLNLAYGFRSNFLAIGVFVLISLAICLFFFQESLPKEKMAPLQMRKITNDFWRILTNLAFWQATVSVSLLFAGYLVFLSVTAVLFVNELGVSKSMFPFYQGACLVAWLIANFLFTPLMTKYGRLPVKKAGMALVFLGGLWLAAMTYLWPQSPVLLTLSMIIYTFGANWLNGIYFPEVMEILPDIKGAASSLLTSARLLLAAGVVGVTSIYYNATIFPITIAIVAIIAIILPTLIAYEHRVKVFMQIRAGQYTSDTASL